MKSPFIFLALFIACAVLITSCSKNSDTPPEEIILEEPISFPHVMFAGPEKQGAARIFANGQEIHDSAYAKSFVSEAALFYFENSSPPRKIQFDSKDTLSIYYTADPAKYGIHKDDSSDLLYNRYPMGDIYEKDSNLVDFFVNPSTGMYHEVLTGHGDYKEFKISLFAYQLKNYRVDAYGEVRLSRAKMGWKISDFKESYISTLGSLDTFAIQEYEIVFKK
jgi:hypothetical protein